MIEYRSLEHTEIENLHKAFVQAFSDYQVELDLPLKKFGNMLQRRGYSPELSIGAFKGPQLIGFVLNGLRSWNGTPTLYDCGTGVLPEYRKQGITTNAFNEVLSLIQANRIEQYLLEVIKSNTPAVTLYRKQEFRITRTLSCFEINTSALKASAPSSVKFETCQLDKLDWPLLTSFWDFAPSWQNSIESVAAEAGSFAALVAYIGETTLGYGIIETSSGDIPQLAVHKEYRRQGIGTGIVHNLKQHTQSDKAVVLNVDEACTSMRSFLQALGFDHFIDQYEMLLHSKFEAETKS